MCPPFEFMWSTCFLIVDQDMDGEAVTAALATTPGPDCLKDVLPKLGQRLKVYKAFQEHITVYAFLAHKCVNCT